MTGTTTVQFPYYQPCASKAVERFVYLQLYGHLTKSKLLFDNQFGFRQRCSTATAFCRFTDILLSNMDEGKFSGVVYLDLKKAFDTVDHKILILKLKAAEVFGLTLNWFHSYLTSRCQRTAVGRSLSGTRRMAVSVPQESILGPLLFLMYITDVHKSLSHASIALFADDTALSFSSSSLEDLQFKLNLVLKNVAYWMNKNKLANS